MPGMTEAPTPPPLPPTHGREPGRTRATKRAVLAGGAVGALVIVSAGAFFLGRSAKTPATRVESTTQPPTATASEFSLTGSLDLKTSSLTAVDLLSDGGPCSGKGGYSDIADGTQVVVSDGAGATLALGQITNSVYSPADCHFDLAVDHIPAGRSFYKVEVSHRGGVQYTEQQMKQGVSLTLGDGD